MSNLPNDIHSVPLEDLKAYIAEREKMDKAAKLLRARTLSKWIRSEMQHHDFLKKVIEDQLDPVSFKNFLAGDPGFSVHIMPYFSGELEDFRG
jgi:hypothetical protein